MKKNMKLEQNAEIETTETLEKQKEKLQKIKILGLNLLKKNYK